MSAPQSSTVKEGLIHATTARPHSPRDRPGIRDLASVVLVDDVQQLSVVNKQWSVAARSNAAGKHCCRSVVIRAIKIKKRNASMVTGEVSTAHGIIIITMMIAKALIVSSEKDVVVEPVAHRLFQGFRWGNIAA